METPQNLNDLDQMVFSDVVRNVHIIAGPNGLCLCGVYDGTPMRCGEILARMSPEIMNASIMANCGGDRINAQKRVSLMEALTKIENEKTN